MISEDLSYRGVRNAQLGRYGSVAEALGAEFLNLLAIYICARSPQPLAILPSTPQPSLNPLSDNIPLQLSHSTDDGEDG